MEGGFDGLRHHHRAMGICTLQTARHKGFHHDGRIWIDCNFLIRDIRSDVRHNLGFNNNNPSERLQLQTHPLRPRYEIKLRMDKHERKPRISESKPLGVDVGDDPPSDYDGG